MNEVIECELPFKAQVQKYMAYSVVLHPLKQNISQMIYKQITFVNSVITYHITHLKQKETWEKPSYLVSSKTIKIRYTLNLFFFFQ